MDQIRLTLFITKFYLLDNRYESSQHKRQRDDTVLMTSENAWYQLVIRLDGNLVIKRYEEIVWQTEMGFFSNYPTRVRINEKGHLIQECQNLYTNTYATYRQDEWLTVWSSAPINHNVTIGTPFDKGYSYVLVLTNAGTLNMYDAVGALIWCTDDDCQHRMGYKFPELYLLPILSNQSTFATPIETNNNNNTHNSIETLIGGKTSLHSVYSMNRTCTGFKSNTAYLVSPNQRYKMFVDDAGNLLVKDGARTMWESVSGHIEYAVGPYELLLAPSGHLFIRSANGYMTWMSVLKRTKEEGDSNYKLSLLDDGRLVVVDSGGDNHQIVWESSPLRGMSRGVTMLRPIEYRFAPCHGQPLKVKKRLLTNQDMYANTRLLSMNGLWDMVILNGKQLVIRKLNVLKYDLFSSKREFERVTLSDDGFIRVSNKANSTLWERSFLNSSLLKQSGGDVHNFTLQLDNNGSLFINDRNNQTVWSLNGELAKYELTSDKKEENNALKIGEYLLPKNSRGELFKRSFICALDFFFKNSKFFF